MNFIIEQLRAFAETQSVATATSMLTGAIAIFTSIKSAATAAKNAKLEAKLIAERAQATINVAEKNKVIETLLAEKADTNMNISRNNALLNALVSASSLPLSAKLEVQKIYSAAPDKVAGITEQIQAKAAETLSNSTSFLDLLALKSNGGKDAETT